MTNFRIMMCGYLVMVGTVITAITYQEVAHPIRCTLYERYTRQISDTVDGPFKPRAYVRCIQEGRE